MPSDANSSIPKAALAHSDGEHAECVGDGHVVRHQLNWSLPARGFWPHSMQRSGRIRACALSHAARLRSVAGDSCVPPLSHRLSRLRCSEEPVVLGFLDCVSRCCPAECPAFRRRCPAVPLSRARDNGTVLDLVSVMISPLHSCRVHVARLTLRFPVQLRSFAPTYLPPSAQ